MRLRNRLLIPILALSILLFVGYETKDFYVTIEAQKQLANTNNQKNISSLIEANKQQTRSIALQLTNDDRVIEAYIKDDPEILKNAVGKIWHTLKQEKIIHEIHFFKPPAISFVNFSNFGSLGKDVSSARKDIVWVTQSFRESNHMMFCKTYAGIRSTQPIIDPMSNKILGGVSLGKQMDWIPQRYYDLTDTNALLIYNNTLAKQLDPKFYADFLADKQVVGDYIIATATAGFPQKALQKIDFQTPTELHINAKHYYFNVLKLKDFNHKDMAYVLIANDFTQYYNDFYAKLFEHGIIFLFAVTFLVLFYKLKFDAITVKIQSMRQLAQQYQNKHFAAGGSEHFDVVKDEIDELKNDIILLGRDLEIFYKDSITKQEELEKTNQNLQIIIDEEVAKNRNREKMLFQQSKLASMGEMIGNIAHQWRQPLSMISTTASGIKLEHEYGLLNQENLGSSLDNIVDATKYLSQTIEDFRAFYTTDKKFEYISTKTLIDDAFHFVEGTFKASNIRAIILVDDFEILTLPNELKQALLNIFTNTKDALGGLNLNDKVMYCLCQEVLDEVVITIYDNAGGIPENVITKIFEPFFTTKTTQHGTGIGLYMTYTIITEHLFGDIKVENFEFIHNNIQYMGAKFIISLPIHTKETQNEK